MLSSMITKKEQKSFVNIIFTFSQSVYHDIQSDTNKKVSCPQSIARFWPVELWFSIYDAANMPVEEGRSGLFQHLSRA